MERYALSSIPIGYHVYSERMPHGADLTRSSPPLSLCTYIPPTLPSNEFYHIPLAKWPLLTQDRESQVRRQKVPDFLS